MDEMITPCGDNCIECPRYNAHSDEALDRVAELWYRVGWRDSIVSKEEIRCSGCNEHKQCTYHLVECIEEHQAEKCNQCGEFPCRKILDMLKRSNEYQQKCRKVCTEQEYKSLKKAFFEKEKHLQVFRHKTLKERAKEFDGKRVLDGEYDWANLSEEN